MHDFIMAEDSELWDIIWDDSYVPTKVLKELLFLMPKTRKEYTNADRKVVEKNFCAKKNLVCGIRPDEYNRISDCGTAKKIWESLQTAHEGTTQVKQYKIDMLTTENKLVRKILSILPSSWESKVNDITEAKDLQELTIDGLVGNLKPYEMKRKIDSGRREPKKEKNLVLKADSNNSSGEDSDMAYLTKRFQKMQEFSKYNPEKAAKRNLVPNKDFKIKRFADNVVKQALAAWGDSSSESEDETDAGDNSMMAVENEENEYDSTFALMAQSDDDEDDDNIEETICELKKEKDVLTKKIANLEHERYDLVVVVVDHKETIEKFSKEKEALIKRVTEIEEERDDLLVVVAYLRETMEGRGTESKPEILEKEKSLLSASQICDKGNKVEFLSKICIVTNLVTGEVVLVAKRYKNIYVADFESLQSSDLSCMKAVDDDVELRHRRLGHASFSLLKKLIQKDLVHGLPISKFKVQKVCDACAREKHVKSSFKSKKDNAEENQDGESLLVPGEVIDMTNRKADMMIQVLQLQPLKLKKEWLVQFRAPRAWYERLSKFILENGFKRGKIDNTLFLKKQGRNLLIFQVYVDDIFFGATIDSLCEEFAKLMGSKFEMSMMGELNFFLGLQVKQSSKGTFICQQKYIRELLKRFDMEISKVIDTPIATPLDWTWMKLDPL
ncbi:uncharacterized protein [Nicotiana sylvestris]|uniref:uncharacterized protein n=1 Tax=Nicotiana sylvestris TaxID=4096 RepID=UPI00388C4A8B